MTVNEVLEWVGRLEWWIGFILVAVLLALVSISKWIVGELHKPIVPENDKVWDNAPTAKAVVHKRAPRKKAPVKPIKKVR